MDAGSGFSYSVYGFSDTAFFMQVFLSGLEKSLAQRSIAGVPCTREELLNYRQVYCAVILVNPGVLLA
jgi:hypothetical protein